MQSTKLTWLIVDDTPVGTDSNVCDFLCVEILKPLLDLLESSTIKVGFAFSVPILKFLNKHENEIFQILQRFVREKKIELVIPLSFPSEILSREAICAHIEYKNHIYREFFDRSSFVLIPFGFAYDHMLLEPSNEMGIKQIVVNKRSMDSCSGITKHRNVCLSVLGVDSELSRLSEQGTAKEFFVRLRDVAMETNGSAVFCSSLHGLGLRIGSFERCWNKGLVKTIIEGLKKSQKWIKTVCPTEHKIPKPVFPIVGYFPLDKEVVSSWKSQFYQNPELAVLWNQLLFVEDQIRESSQRQSMIELQDASIFLPYPNGRLEDMQFRHLLWFEISEIFGDCILPSGECADKDGDGTEELYFRSSIGDGACMLAYGGMITMLLIPGVGNICNVLTRRKRNWHNQIADDPRLPMLLEDTFREGISPQNPNFYNRLGYDEHHRGLFSDRIFAPDVTLSQIRKGQARTYVDLTSAKYRILTQEEDYYGYCLDIESQVTLKTPTGSHSITIQKNLVFSFEEQEITVEYIVENNSLEPIEFLWGVELNVGLTGSLRPDSVFRMSPHPFSCSMAQAGHRKDCSNVEWIFPEGTFRAQISEESPVFFYPIEVPCTKPKTIDLSYQGHCVTFGVPVSLWSGEKRSWKVFCRWEKE